MVLTMRDYMPERKLRSVLRVGVVLDCSTSIMQLMLLPIHSSLSHLDACVVMDITPGSPNKTLQCQRHRGLAYYVARDCCNIWSNSAASSSLLYDMFSIFFVCFLYFPKHHSVYPSLYISVRVKRKLELRFICALRCLLATILLTVQYCNIAQNHSFPL